MKHEFDSLEQRKVFECTFLPVSHKAIGVHWTFDYKYNPDGSIIVEKEKARLVAQGFSQRPEDFGETYAPVVKLTSIRIILAFANAHDYEIMSFDVKTAFLHARLPYSIYVKQILGYPKENPHTVLKLLIALYGLKQSAYEWYKISSVLSAYYVAKQIMQFSSDDGQLPPICLFPLYPLTCHLHSSFLSMSTMAWLSPTPSPYTNGS